MEDLTPAARPFALLMITSGAPEPTTMEERDLVRMLGPVDAIGDIHLMWLHAGAALAAGDADGFETHRRLVERAGLLEEAQAASRWVHAAGTARRHLRRTGYLPRADHLPAEIRDKAKVLSARAARMASLLMPAAGALPPVWDATLMAIIEALACTAPTLIPLEVRDLTDHRCSHPKAWPAWFGTDADYGAARALAFDLWLAVEALRGRELLQDRPH